MASSNPDALIEFLRGAAEYRGPPLPSLKPSTMPPIISRASVDALWKQKQETHPVSLITGDDKMGVFRHQAAYAKHTNARVMIVVGVETRGGSLVHWRYIDGTVYMETDMGGVFKISV